MLGGVCEHLNIQPCKGVEPLALFDFMMLLALFPMSPCIPDKLLTPVILT